MFLTETSYSGTIDVPIAIPQTNVERATSVVVASFQLVVGQSFRIRWMNIHAVKTTTKIPDELERVNDNLCMAYVGLFSADFDQILKPSGVPIVFAEVDQFGRNGIGGTNSYGITDCMAPGLYQILLVNNLQNMDLELSVTGAFRVFEVN